MESLKSEDDTMSNGYPPVNCCYGPCGNIQCASRCMRTFTSYGEQGLHFYNYQYPPVPHLTYYNQQERLDLLQLDIIKLKAGLDLLEHNFDLLFKRTTEFYDYFTNLHFKDKA